MWPLSRVALERGWVGESGNRKGVAGPPALHSGRVSPYQVDVIHFYVPEEDAGHMLCVPLHTWVVWEIPGRKKHNLSTVSNEAQTSP